MIELLEGTAIEAAVQKIKDVLNGGLTFRNQKTFRTFFVVTAQDSMDSTYPVLVPFNIPSDTVNIASVRVSFWILPFRAYSKAAASNTQQTSSSGGGASLTSGSGGGQTSSASSNHSHTVTISSHSHDLTASNLSTGTTDGHYHSYQTARVSTDSGGGSTPTSSSGGSHTHTVVDHTHSVTVSSHAHTVDAHTHDITFGIYEEDNAPSVTMKLSKDGGITYPFIIGTYVSNQVGIDITDYIGSNGAKILKFEATDLGRISVQIELKLDLSR